MTLRANEREAVDGYLFGAAPLTRGVGSGCGKVLIPVDATSGLAQGSHTTGFKLPAGAVITRGIWDVRTSFVGGGSVSAGIDAVDDVLAVTASPAAAVPADAAQDDAIANVLKVAADGELALDVTVADFTDGLAYLVLEYYVP